MNTLEQVWVLANKSYVYAPQDKEAINISYVCSVDADENTEEVDYFEGTGVDTFEQYTIYFTEVDLSTDKFFKLMEVVV
jgi:hypothetical protein